MLSCRSIYTETLLQLYANMKFVFVSSGSAARFLETVTPAAKAAIRHIELRHVTFERFGSPTRQVKTTEGDEAWRMVCERMVREFTSLRTLRIREVVDVNSDFIQVGEAWSTPYFYFFPSQYAGQVWSVEVSVKRPHELQVGCFYPRCTFRYATVLREVSLEL